MKRNLWKQAVRLAVVSGLVLGAGVLWAQTTSQAPVSDTAGSSAVAQAPAPTPWMGGPRGPRMGRGGFPGYGASPMMGGPGFFGRGGRMGRGARGFSGGPGARGFANCPFGWGPGVGRGIAPRGWWLNPEQLEQQLTERSDGVELIVTSDEPTVAAGLQAHFQRLKQRWDAGMPYRIWDPLFADLYLHRDQIELTVENRTDGVRIVVRGTTEDAAKLAQEYGKVLSAFLESGPAEMAKSHPSPLRAE